MTTPVQSLCFHSNLITVPGYRQILDWQGLLEVTLQLCDTLTIIGHRVAGGFLRPQPWADSQALYHTRHRHRSMISGSPSRR